MIQSHFTRGKKNLPDAANFIPNLSQASPKGMILGLKDLRQHLGISVLSSPHLWMTAVSLDGGSLISALWKWSLFELEGGSLRNSLKGCLTSRKVKWDPDMWRGPVIDSKSHSWLASWQPLHTALPTPSSLHSFAPHTAGGLHRPLLESCWPCSCSSFGVQPHSSLSPQHVCGLREFEFPEAEKCPKCSHLWPVVWTGQMERNLLWFCLDLLFQYTLPPWDSVPSPISSVQFSSVTRSCLTLCDPMKCSTPGLPVHHQPPEFTQTHIHRVGDTIPPSHPLPSPSPPAPNPSQQQGLFQWVSSSHEVAKVLEFQL